MLEQRILDAITAIVGDDGVVSRPAEARVYECDGYTLARSVPELVVLPSSRAEVAALLRLLHREGIAFVPRGAGTGLSGGCLPVQAPVMICTSRMNRILEIDLANRRVVVEAGVVNLSVTRAVQGDGLMYAPDPSSQSACTIGGNVAENSGGPHTLKYGVTTNHVLAVELVLPDGEVVHPGRRHGGRAGVRSARPGRRRRRHLRHRHRGRRCGWCASRSRGARCSAVFDSVDDASSAVSGIIAAGMVPAALEMMDQLIVQAVEAAFHFGFPLDAGAVLIVELDGPAAGLDEQAQR